MTVFLQNGGFPKAAQNMANHADPLMTKLYDRRKDLATLNEVERRIAFEWVSETSISGRTPLSRNSCGALVKDRNPGFVLKL